jgi:hypothetical protein
MTLRKENDYTYTRVNRKVTRGSLFIRTERHNNCQVGQGSSAGANEYDRVTSSSSY